MFRPYKWVIIRLLVEPMGRLYTRSLGGDEISSCIILWGSRLLILHMIYGYHVEHCYLRNCRLKCRVIQGKKLGSVYSKNVPRMPIPFPQEIYFTVASHLTRNNGDFSLILIMKLDSLAWV